MDLVSVPKAIDGASAMYMKCSVHQKQCVSNAVCIKCSVHEMPCASKAVCIKHNVHQMQCAPKLTRGHFSDSFKLASLKNEI